MRIAHPQLLWLLLFVPVVVLAYVIAFTRRRRLLKALGSQVLIARMSRAGAIAAAAIVVMLIAAGVNASRQAARDWAAAGKVVRTIALELKRLYPALPAGVDVVLAGVPLRIGRADVHVLYAREAVLQAYDRRDRHDVRVFFAEDLRSPESYHVRSAAPVLDRPARYFHFNLETLTLAEAAGARRRAGP